MRSAPFYCCLLAILACTRLCTGVPEITEHPTGHDAYLNETFSMSCTASGYAFKMWIFDNRQERTEVATATADYDVTSTETSSSLKIKAFKKKLAGEYRCLFTREGVGSILTKPATVKHFAQLTVVEQPKDFNSYTLRATNGALYRDVFAFKCSFGAEPFSILPTITWERCNLNRTFSPIEEATESVPTPGQATTNDPILTPTHIFFQTNRTGYLQIHDTNNSAYMGARYRCKARSNIAQDSQEPIYSDCARIIHHPYPTSVPADVPLFSTVPIQRVYFDVGLVPVMACTVQRRSDMLPPKLLHSEELVAVPFASFLPFTTDFPTSHLTLLGQLNLQFDGSSAVGMMIFEQTFTCQAHRGGELIRHNTTFFRDRPLIPDSSSSFTNHTFREDDYRTIYFVLKGKSSFQVVRVFNDGEPTTLKHSFEEEFESGKDRHVFTIDSVEAQHEGIIQLEVENRANIVAEYHHVHVLLKARAVTPDGTVVGRVTQTLKIDCKAKVNLEDADVIFTWKIGDNIEDTITVRATNGMAKATLVIPRLSMEKYHGKTLECHPRNDIGVYNFTQFNISVEHFPPPNITKFRFQPDHKDEIDVEWLPVNVMGYPGASVEKYNIELASDKDGSLIEDRATVKGGNVSHVFKVDKCSKSYWVRVKAVNGNQDVSSFSGWVPLEPVTCPIVTAPAGVPPGWAIFLIIFFLLLLCLLCLFLLCCLLLFCKRKKDPKGVYYAEKREKLYQADRASYSALQAQECATLAKLS